MQWDCVTKGSILVSVFKELFSEEVTGGSEVKFVVEISMEQYFKKASNLILIV